MALTVPAEDAFLAEMDGAALADLLIVSKVEVTVGSELAVSVSEAAGTKCPPLLEAQHRGGRERPVPPLRRCGGQSTGVLIRRWITSSRPF